MVDYIIVGLGLGGLAITRELDKRGKTFLVYEDGSQQSSVVAGGLYNPVILKHFTLAWRAKEQLALALPFYDDLEQLLKTDFHLQIPVFRKFGSVEEQNNWFSASDKIKLEDFLDPEIKREINPGISGNFGFGKINQTGIIQTEKLLNSYKTFLLSSAFLKLEKFDYSDLNVLPDSVSYKGIGARGIIFCEGFGLKSNPFFNYLPLIGNKGEYLIIKSADLDLNVIVKSSIFIIPLGEDLYKVGASYKHNDKSPQPTSETRGELKKQLDALITCSYEIVGQEAGIRPSTADRKPLVGIHPEHRNLYLCNGFGSRGVLIAPSMAKHLMDLIFNNETLDAEIDIQRFNDRYFLN